MRDRLFRITFKQKDKETLSTQYVIANYPSDAIAIFAGHSRENKAADILEIDELTSVDITLIGADL